MPKRWPTSSANLRSSVSSGGIPWPLSWNAVRMKDMREYGSSWCCASVMRPLFAARNPAIAATIPVVSGQAVVRMWSRRGGLAAAGPCSLPAAAESLRMRVDMRDPLPGGVEEPIPQVSRKAAVDEAAEALGFPRIPDDRGDVGERGAYDATGRERVRMEVDA